MIEKVEFTNMCMIRDKNKVLVINRKAKDWPGTTFPGGHVGSVKILSQIHFLAAVIPLLAGCRLIVNLAMKLQFKQMLHV